LAAIGITDATIRVNHRILLANLLDGLGVPEEGRGSAMIIIDKLDKIFAEGVVTELAEKFGAEVGAAAKDWLETKQSELPVLAELTEIFAAVETRHPGKLRFDQNRFRARG
jgi:histidyl-tRNA synthetase